jgi:hypothetical protein
MRHHLVLIAIAFGLASGCGGSSAASGGTTVAAEDEPVTEPPVADAPVEEEPEVADEPAAPEPTGPGQLRVINRVGGEDASGTVRVLSEAGEVVVEGTSGQTFTVPSGSYRVVGAITDDDVMIDTPTHEADGMVTVLAGQEQSVSIDFPLSRVRIRVRRHGRPVARWRMEVRRQDGTGEPLTLRSSNDHIPITPGRYDATLHFGREQIEVSGIIFQGGATMDVPVNID